MRKSIVIGGIVILAAAAAVVVYINMKPGAKKPDKEGTTVTAPSHEPEVKPQTAQGPPNKPKPVQPAKPNALQPSISKEQHLDNFFVHSQAHAQVDALDGFFKSILDSMGPEERKKLEPIVEKMLHLGLDDYKKALSEKFSEQELKDLDSIYMDPEFAAFNSESIEAMNLTRMQEIQEGIVNFDKNNIPADRLEALGDLADAQIRIQGPHLEGEIDGGRELSFSELLKNAYLAEFDALTKGKSSEQIRHIAAKMNDPLVVAQRQLQQQAFKKHMGSIEEAAMEQAMEQSMEQ